jgi:hypothetical protein
MCVENRVNTLNRLHEKSISPVEVAEDAPLVSGYGADVNRFPMQPKGGMLRQGYQESSGSFLVVFLPVVLGSVCSSLLLWTHAMSKMPTMTLWDRG